MTERVAVALGLLVLGLFFSLFARTIDKRNGDSHRDTPSWYIFAYRSNPVHVYLFRAVGIALVVAAVGVLISLGMG